MPLSDFIEPSVSDQARQRLFERKLAVRKKLYEVKLSTLEMNGEEFCAYMRIMGLNPGIHEGREPNEWDIALFEKKLDPIK